MVVANPVENAAPHVVADRRDRAAPANDEAKPAEPPSNRLEPAPPAVCYLIAVAYVYLCDQGVEHCRRLQKTGRTDVPELMIEWCILLVVYSIETLLACNGMTSGKNSKRCMR